jgi:serine/threonine protein kinase
MDDMTDFDIDSIIRAQLCDISVSRESALASVDVRKNPQTEGIATCFSEFTFASSELIDLLEVLEVPFIHTRKHIQTPRHVSDGTMLGRGGFAEVSYDGNATVTNKSTAVAIKEFKPSTIKHKVDTATRIQSMSSSAVTQAFIEVCIMRHPRLICHPNILQLLGITETDNSGILKSMTTSQLALVTEYADSGCLDSYLHRHKEIDWTCKSQWICDIVAGLQSLHACDIVHNDLKCSNVLLFSSHEGRTIAKLGDFGCSIPLAITMCRKEPAGTLLFAAPEAYSQQSIVHPSRDLYSLGLIIFHILTGSPPFRDLNSDQVLDYKRNETRLFRYINDIFSAGSWTPTSDVLNLLKNTLKADPQERSPDFSHLRRLFHQRYFASELN